MRLLGRLGRPSSRDVLAAVVVLGGLVAFVVLTYLALVVGVGALLGQTSSPHLGLSVLATAVVALGFDPVQTRLESFAARVVRGGRSSPYDVLRRFTATMAGAQPAAEQPERMARVLAEGTGAHWAQVWVMVGERSVLAATWPPPTAASALQDGEAPGTRRLAVSQGDEVLGELVLREREGVPLTPVEERLFAGLADQAGLVLRGARLRAQLELRLAELSARADELRVSRERLVDAHDAERRRLERDIHDGAQQHLVALAVNLRLAATLAERSPQRAESLLDAQVEAADQAVATLLQLARGIYPPLLEEGGVVAALRSAVVGSGRPVELVEDRVGRYPRRVEAAAYFCCLEALQNAVKHAGATTIRVELRGQSDQLALTVEDDGAGFDPATTSVGAGLTNIRDRVESVGGTLTIDSVPGGGSRVRAVLPARALATTGSGA